MTPAGEGGELYEIDLAQDLKGRLHAVWRRNRPAADQLRYSRRSKAGKPWSKPKTVAVRGDLFHIRVAVGKDGRGLIVWDENNATGGVWAVTL